MTGILIAEDERRIASFLEKGLRAQGFSTAVATDRRNALRLARSGHFSLLVVDLDLFEGTELVRELRATAPPLPVVMLWGKRRVEDYALPPGEAGMCYLKKPFSFPDLLMCIALGEAGREPLSAARGPSARPAPATRRKA